LLLVAFLLLNVPNCHLSLVLASVVQGDVVNCNTGLGLGGYDLDYITAFPGKNQVLRSYREYILPIM